MKAWEKHERAIAERHGGRRTPGSGNGIRKNDVRNRNEWPESWEAKSTAAAQFALKVADLLAAETHALRDGRRMVFCVQFEKKRRSYVVLAEEDYAELKWRAGADRRDPVAEDPGRGRGGAALLEELE